MSLVETRALTAEMGPTESITNISDAGAAGSPWADPIYHLSERPPRVVPFQSSILRVRLTPLTMATGRKNAPMVPRGKAPMGGEPRRSVSFGDIKECLRYLIQDGPSSILGRRCTHID
jgi:hypothetical protein